MLVLCDLLITGQRLRSFSLVSGSVFVDVYTAEYDTYSIEYIRPYNIMLLFQGAVFDLPTDKTKLIESKWTNSDRLNLTQADTLPELIEDTRTFDRRRGASGGWGGGGGRSSRDFQGRRGGSSFGGGGRGNGRGMKRRWNNN